MEGHAKKCVERYCELANKTTQQLYKVSTPCLDDHHFKEEELKSVGELSKVCWQSHFFTISWKCKKQTSVSHSSTESEIISLDAGLPMDGTPALDLWELVFEVLHSSSNQPSSKHTNTQIETQIQHNDLELSTVDYVSSHAKSSRSGALLYFF